MNKKIQDKIKTMNNLLYKGCEIEQYIGLKETCEVVPASSLICKENSDFTSEPDQRSIEYNSIKTNSYEDLLEDMVKKRFAEHKRIRTVRRIVSSGRAKRNQLWTDNGCCCDDLFVDPVGDVYSCGCRKHKFGNVINGIDTYKIQEWYDWRGVGFGECAFTRR